MNRFGWLAWAFALTLPNGAVLAQSNRSVTIVMPSAPHTVDPCEISSSPVGRITSGNIYEALVRMNFQTAAPEPLLSESWSQTAPNRWAFKLRVGVKFHDGSDFDAADVVHSLQRTLDPKLQCHVRNSYFANTDITAVAKDAHTVEFTTAEPSPILPTLLAKLAIAPDSAPIGERTDNAAGTGPYKLESWDHKERLVLSRYDGYWGNKPDIQTANYTWRSETSVAAAMVETGEADIAFSIAPQDATNPKTDTPYLNSETAVLRPSNNLPPFSDVRVRRAVNLAIDRQAMLGSLINEGAQFAMQRVGPGVLGYNPKLTPWPFDPAKATALLEEARAAGVPVDTKIVLVGRLGIFPNSSEVIEVVAEMLRAVGLNIQVDLVDVIQQRGVLTKPFDASRPVNLVIDVHDNNTGDASFTVFNKYHSKGSQSVTANPEVDRMIAQASAAKGDERQAIYQELFRMIAQDLVEDVPLFHMVNIMRIREGINFTPTRANAAELKVSDIKIN